MRNFKIFLILATFFFICSCIASINRVGSRANTSTYYNEMTSHLTTKTETIKELRRMFEEEEMGAESAESSEHFKETMITSKLITQSGVALGIGKYSISCDWCDIREAYIEKATTSLAPGKEGYIFSMKCPGLGRNGIGFVAFQKETSEKFHAVALKMIELCNCK